MIKNILLTIVAILTLSQPILINLLPYDFQWFYWNISLLISLVCVSFLLLAEIKYTSYVRKFFSFLIFDIFCYGLVDFIIKSGLELQGTQDIYYYEYFSIIFSGIVLAVFIRSYIKFFIKSGDKYVRNNSYLVYKYPKSIWGILASIYTAPYGHCFLVVDKAKFYYKNGVIREVVFQASKQKNNLIYRRIDKVDIEEARKLVGKKWSIFNNCFSTFRRFK